VTYNLPTARRHLRRNWTAFFSDNFFFGIGLTFASVSTILPAFAALLTDNKIIIGATAAVWTGAWLLPQIFAAHWLSDKTRKWPVMFWGELIGRPIMIAFVVWVLVTGLRFPTLTLIFFFIAITYFRMTDAVVALAWFDLLGKALAPELRGRLIGVGQVLTGVAALGAGVLIRYVFSDQGPAFPYNYAVVFGLAALCFTLSEIACVFVVEQPEAVAEVRPTIREYLPQLARLLQSDQAFRRVTLVRLLAGLGTLASTFYVLYATRVLSLPPQSIGLFAGAATGGAALAGVLLGVVADRLGTHRVIQVITWCQFAVPVMALLVHFGVFGSAAGAVFPLLYVLMGAFDGSVMLGFLNYVLEISLPGQRPTYMGLTNTLSGLLVLVPLAGGWVLEHSSYPLLFGLAAMGTLPAALLALTLPNPRQSVAAEASEVTLAAPPGLPRQPVH